MTSPLLFLLALCASLLSLTSAQTSLVFNRSWQPCGTFDRVLGGIPEADPVDDCTNPEQEAAIRQAFNDAVVLAANARDGMRNGPRPHVWAYYDRVFKHATTPGATYSWRKVAHLRPSSPPNEIPNEIIFHCGDRWHAAVARRATNYGVTGDASSPQSGLGAHVCEASSGAFMSRIKSGTFPPDVFSDFGPQGAFRSGVHITICPHFYDWPALNNIRTVTENLEFAHQNNQAWFMLHEMMHAYSESILDAGYGHAGIVNVSDRILPPDRLHITPLTNADTWAIFAMVISPVGGMNLWDWTTGFAVRTPASPA
ncbi:uncharacterized protein B0T15DRAFT_553639 [Chaetomium strumarium]|uniref:Lysine-specific metallo-endopeptidase domain-containing protein n=1 Tax=Chaetomium strumarium TaxID=1170767 RepID=A0AAJ0GW03_9PEZI|nr:hypothetical protein B0T15DRAFT_553639 [Chaetomium strumarium]